MRIRSSLALLLAAAGCTTTYNIPKAELSRLDGWVAQDGALQEESRLPPHQALKGTRRLRDTEGRERPFTEDTPLVLVQRDGEVIAEKYVEVNVDGLHFRGVPQSAFRRTIEIPLSELESAGVRELSLGRTVLFSTGLVLGLTAVLFGMKQAIGERPPRPPEEGAPCGELGCEF